MRLIAKCSLSYAFPNGMGMALQLGLFKLRLLNSPLRNILILQKYQLASLNHLHIWWMSPKPFAYLMGVTEAICIFDGCHRIHLHIWWVSPQLSFGDTCQIWTWYQEVTRDLIMVKNRMAWQWAETLVEIRGNLADIRGTTKLRCRCHFPKHGFNRPVCLEAHHYLLAHLSQ